MKRVSMKWLFVLMLGVGVPYVTDAPTAEAAVTTIIVESEADAYVQKGSGASQNYGDVGMLALRGDRHRDTFLRFDLSVINYPILSAELQLDVNSGDAASFTNIDFVSADTWGEGTITHNTRPSAGANIATGTMRDPNGPVVFDVTATAAAEQAGDGKLSMVVYSTLGGTDSYSFHSRETTSGYAPRLIITVDTAVSLLPDADAYVQQNSGASTNFGASDKLALRGDRYREAFIRFDLSGVSIPIGNVELRLDGGPPGANPATTAAFVADDSWNESTITHNTRPSTGADIAIGARISAGAPAAFNVTEQAVKERDGDGKLSMLLYSTLNDSTSYNFHSRESVSGIRPTLVIEPATATASLPADAVATVQSGSHTGTNFADTLVTKYNNKFGYIRYDLSGFSGEITSAKIRLAGNADMVSAAFVDDDSWNSATLTYANAPASGSYIAAGQYGSDGFIELDVTSRARAEQAGDGELSLKLFTTASDGNNYLFGAYPELLVTAIYKPEISSVTVEPEVRFTKPTIAIPLNGSVVSRFVSKVRDQNGGVMSDETVNWLIDGSPAGVSVNAAGQLIVTSAASSGMITLRAVSDTDDEIQGTLALSLRASQVNVKSHPYAFYDTSDLTGLRSKIGTSHFSDWYESMEEAADRYTSAELADIPEIYPWRTFTFTFQAPANAETARFSLQLRGTGSVAFDNAKLILIGQGYETISNAGFEAGTAAPFDWNSVSINGNPQFSWENNATLGRASEGTRMVSITNDGGDDSGGWETAVAVYVEPGQMYSLQIDINQNDLLEDGVYLIASFKDEFGADTGEELRSLRYNTTTPTKRSGLGLAENAMVYAMTDDEAYAERTWKLLAYTLEDMQYRMVNWLLTSQDPDQSSRAVHIGRALGGAAIAYDMIADSGVATAEEDNRIRSLFYWIADKLMDRSYYDYENDGDKRSNFNSDRAAGLGIFALVFPEYAYSEDYLEHALNQIEWQLEHVVGDDGGWPESIRYHQAVMDRWIALAKMLNRQGSVNLFSNVKFKKMFQFLIETQTPADMASVTAPGLSGYPAIGDHNWREAVHILGLGASEYKVADATFSKNMMYAWNRSGAVIRSYYSILSLVAIDASLPEEAPNLGSMKFEDMGYVLFRNNYGDKNKESFMAIVGGEPQLKSHQHSDRGSFSLYADSTPLSLDPGVSAYGTGVNPNWFQAAPSHNVVQFKDANGNYKDGPTSSAISDTHFSNELDYVRIDIPDKLATSYKRHIGFVKEPFEAYIIWDAIDSTNASRIRFHTLSTDHEIVGSRVTAEGYNNKDLEMTFLQQSIVSIAPSTGSLAVGYGQEEQEHFTVEESAGEHYLTVLYPKDRSEDGLTIAELAVNRSDARAYLVTDGDGKSFVFVVNGGIAQSIEIEIDNDLTEMRTAVTYFNTAGFTTVTGNAQSIHFFAI